MAPTRTAPSSSATTSASSSSAMQPARSASACWSAAEWEFGKNGPNTLTAAEVARVAGHFTTPAYETLPAEDAGYAAQRSANPAFAAWARRNVLAHKVPGYAIVVLSLKDPKRAPGDITDAQLDQVADWADAYSFGEVRATHEQNLVLADVRQSDLFAV